MTPAEIRKRLGRLGGNKRKILAGVIRVPADLAPDEEDAWVDEKIAELLEEGYVVDPRYGLAILPDDADDRTWAELAQRAQAQLDDDDDISQDVKRFNDAPT